MGTTEGLMFRLVSHNGDYHLDELVACGIIAISLALTSKEVRLSYHRVDRHEDTELLKLMDEAERGRAAIIDIGEVSRGANFLDHHQWLEGCDLPESRRQFGNGQPYAAAGLAWAQWGRGFVESVAEEMYRLHKVDAARYNPQMIKDVWLQVDQEWISWVDRGDLEGYKPKWVDGHKGKRERIINPLEMLNTVVRDGFPVYQDAFPDDDQAYDDASLKAFVQASHHVTRQLQAITRACLKKWMDAASDMRPWPMADRRLMKFCRYGDQWLDIAQSEPEAAFATWYDRQPRLWVVMCVWGSDKKFRVPLPTDWWAKRGKPLQRLTGIPGALQVDPSGRMFFCRTLDDAEALVRLAVREQEIHQRATAEPTA